MSCRRFGTLSRSHEYIPAAQSDHVLLLAGFPEFRRKTAVSYMST
jgi:hypothetical protein